MSNKALKGIDLELFANYERQHTRDEKSSLMADLSSHGCREPLTVGIINGKKFLVDGFSRLAYCQELKISFDTVEVEFSSIESAEDWIDCNSSGRRNKTRTEFAFAIGRKYQRRKQPHGGQIPNGKKDRQNLPIPTCDELAGEFHCSPRHIKNCHKIFLHLEEAENCGMKFLKQAILTERIKYSKKLVDELIYLGPGGCQLQIEALLNQEEKPITPKAIREAVGIQQDPAEENPPMTPTGAFMIALGKAKEIFRNCDDLGDIQAMRLQANAVLEEIDSMISEMKKNG